MEVLLLLGVGLSSGLCVALLLWDGAPIRSSGARRLERLAHRRVRAMLERLGRTRPMALMLEFSPWAQLAREVSRSSLGTFLDLGIGDACAALVLCMAFACALAGALFASVVSAAAVAVTCVVGVHAWDASRRRRMREEVSFEMPGIYRTLSVAMSSGQTLAQAVEYVGSHGRGPAAEVFSRMSLRLSCGVSTEDAVQELSEELDAPGVELLATALVISHRTGSPLRELLLRSARLVERQGEFERLLSVKTAQVRLSVKIVCLLPLVMICLLALISPDFQQGLLTPTGMGCVLVALALDGVALLIIRRLVRGVL